MTGKRRLEMSLIFLSSDSLPRNIVRSLFSALVDSLSLIVMRITLIICVMQLFSMMIAQTGSIKRFVILLLDSYSWNVSPTLAPCRCLMRLLFNKV